MDGYFTIKEVVEKYIEGCQTKMQMSSRRLLGKAAMAGMMIAMGAGIRLCKIIVPCIYRKPYWSHINRMVYFNEWAIKLFKWDAWCIYYKTSNWKSEYFIYARHHFWNIM